MLLRETKLESFGLAGCIVPSLFGGVLGSIFFWFLTPSNDGDFEGMSESLGFLNVLIGFCVGSFLLGSTVFIVDRVKEFKRAAAEEAEENRLKEDAASESSHDAT